MPVLSEDTFGLLRLIEQNDALYDDCYRIASQMLEKHPPRGDIRQGVGRVAATARSELSGTLKNVVLYADDANITAYLNQARVDWQDVAREILADVLCAS